MAFLVCDNPLAGEDVATEDLHPRPPNDWHRTNYLTPGCSNPIDISIWVLLLLTVRNWEKELGTSCHAICRTANGTRYLFVSPDIWDGSEGIGASAEWLAGAAESCTCGGWDCIVEAVREDFGEAISRSLLSRNWLKISVSARLDALRVVESEWDLCGALRLARASASELLAAVRQGASTLCTELSLFH